MEDAPYSQSNLTSPSSRKPTPPRQLYPTFPQAHCNIQGRRSPQSRDHTPEVTSQVTGTELSRTEVAVDSVSAAEVFMSSDGTSVDPSGSETQHRRHESTSSHRSFTEYCGLGFRDTSQKELDQIRSREISSSSNEPLPPTMKNLLLRGRPSDLETVEAPSCRRQSLVGKAPTEGINRCAPRHSASKFQELISEALPDSHVELRSSQETTSLNSRGKLGDEMGRSQAEVDLSLASQTSGAPCGHTRRYGEILDISRDASDVSTSQLEPEQYSHKEVDKEDEWETVDESSRGSGLCEEVDLPQVSKKAKRMFLIQNDKPTRSLIIPEHGNMAPSYNTRENDARHGDYSDGLEMAGGIHEKDKMSPKSVGESLLHGAGPEITAEPCAHSIFVPRSKRFDVLQDPHLTPTDLPHHSSNFSPPSSIASSKSTSIKYKMDKLNNSSENPSQDMAKPLKHNNEEIEQGEELNPSSDIRGKGKDRATKGINLANLPSNGNEDLSMKSNDGSYTTITSYESELSRRFVEGNFDTEDDHDVSSFLRSNKCVNHSNSYTAMQNEYGKLLDVGPRWKNESDSVSSKVSLAGGVKSTDPTASKKKKKTNRLFLMSEGSSESDKVLRDRFDALNSLAGASPKSPDTSHSQTPLMNRQGALNTGARYEIQTPAHRYSRLPGSRDSENIIRLPQDARVRRGYLNPADVRAQHDVGLFCIVFGILTFPFGGFLLIKSMIEDGEYARSAFVSISPLISDRTVNVVHARERQIARRVQIACFALVTLGGLLCIAVYIWVIVSYFK